MHSYSKLAIVDFWDSLVLRVYFGGMQLHRKDVYDWFIQGSPYSYSRRFQFLPP